MNNSLDISIHGPQRVAIVEQLVHICRYMPGLVLLEGDAGKSPVNFLRDMADLLRDELDFALLDNNHCEISIITTELVSQWYIYQSEDNEQTDVQTIHHYLDIGLQSGRLALIVIERASLLTDEAINFLVSMMARHSRLTVLFAGIVDARPLLRRAQQAEVPVHRIDMPDASESVSPNLSSSNFDHTFSDDSYAVPDDDAFEDDLYESDFLVAEPRGKREPLIGKQSPATQSSIRISTSDSVFGMSTHLSVVQAWGAATLAGIRKRKSGGALLLMVGFLALVMLLLLMAIDSRDATDAVPALLEVTQLPSSPPVIGAPVPSSVATAVAAPAAVVAPASTTAVPTAKPLTSAPVIENKVADPVPVITELVNAKPVAKAVPFTEKQWRAKPANYTIQVAAAYSEKNIRELAAKLPVSSPHLVYQARRDSKPWFVLIYGSFATKQAASSARDSLAADLKKDSTPWVRKQGEIFAQ